MYDASDVSELDKEELRVPPGLAEALDPVVRVQPMPLLAGDKVAYVGQPVAMVIAENRYLAEDAAEAITVGYEPLPVVTDPDAALTDGAPIVQDGWEDNLALAIGATAGKPGQAFSSAHTVIEEEFQTQRYVASPIEPRGITAAPDPFSGRLTVWSCTRPRIACVITLPPACPSRLPTSA